MNQSTESAAPASSTGRSRMRVAALLAAATPITAAVFAFAAPAAAAVPTAAAHGGGPLSLSEDPCHFTVAPAGLNTFKLPLCAGD